MTTTNDRATLLLERGTATAPSQDSRDGTGSRRGAAQPAPAASRHRDQSPASRDGRRTPDAQPVPLGWGSHEERRSMRLALAAFLLLGLYAVGFVLLGHLLST